MSGCHNVLHLEGLNFSKGLFDERMGPDIKLVKALIGKSVASPMALFWYCPFTPTVVSKSFPNIVILYIIIISAQCRVSPAIRVWGMRNVHACANS